MGLIGVDVVDERPLAGRLVGWMFVMGSIVTTLLPLLPGVDGAVITPTLPIGIAAFVWGVVCVTRIDWRNASGRLMHLGPAAGALCSAVATHDNGGANSPARFLLMLVVVYACYFFPPGEAWPYLPLALGLHALPFAYDRQAVPDGLLGELLIVGPCYALLAFLLLKGKRGMIALRATADELARRDPLTGLANRRALLEGASRQGSPARGDARGAAHPGALGLLLIDVDDFKRFNTLHGHPGGDRVLVALADCLRGAVRTGDLAARLGGDEFAVLVTAPTHEGMEALSARVLAAVRAGTEARVSAGWAIGDAGADALLLAADRALALAKHGGKDRALSAA
jgi:diguanylate cyclase (GGDEF)-like protein